MIEATVEIVIIIFKTIIEISKTNLIKATIFAPFFPKIPEKDGKENAALTTSHCFPSVLIFAVRPRRAYLDGTVSTVVFWCSEIFWEKLPVPPFGYVATQFGVFTQRLDEL